MHGASIIGGIGDGRPKELHVVEPEPDLVNNEKYNFNLQVDNMPNMKESALEIKVQVAPNGPYLVSGKVPLAKEVMVSVRKGVPIEWKTGESYPSKEVYP